MPIPQTAMSAAAPLAAGGLTPDASFPYGLAMRFAVSVDDLDLGSWSACKGLKVELKVTRVAEGGNYWYDRILPDRISYPTVTLERAVHPRESRQVQNWLRTVARGWMNYSGGDSYQAGTATITLLGATGQQVMTWTLDEVYPVSWSGPALSATENKVAIETLELAHQGFLTSNPAVPSP